MTDINQLLHTAVSTGQSTWYIFLLAFLAGIFVSFTPCVYPMIPITAGILQSQAGNSFVYNFLSSLLYIIGIALVYASLGYVCATTSIIFGRWLASPWFIAGVIMFFLYLAGAMFGWYEFYIPHFLQYHGVEQKKRTLFNSFIFGIISGTVASPCLTPALAILLGVAAKQANPLLGFFTLFFFALGMGILLLLIGTFSATLTMLPRAGEWMNHIKTAFGFLMLITCIYFAQPLLNDCTVMIGYALVAVAASIFYIRNARSSKLALILGIIALLSAITLSGYIVKMLM